MAPNFRQNSAQSHKACRCAPGVSGSLHVMHLSMKRMRCAGPSGFPTAVLACAFSAPVLLGARSMGTSSPAAASGPGETDRRRVDQSAWG